MNIKKGILFSLSVVLAISLVIPLQVVSAAQVQPEDILEQLEVLDFGRDIEFFFLEQNNYASRIAAYSEDMLHFDSIEEFEEFMANFILALDNTEVPTIYLEYSELDGITSRFIRNSMVSWWAPMGAGSSIFTVKNISFSYSFTRPGPVISNPVVLSSWATGIVHGWTWTHRFGNAFMSGGSNTARLSATGTWTATMSIVGIPIGAAFNETWNANAVLPS